VSELARLSDRRRLFHFTHAKFALDDIRHARLKIAELEDLNDPFELRCMDTTFRGNRIGYVDWRKEAAKRWGVLCFSETWKDILQWSHYADRHRGICLGFDVIGDPRKFGKVEYREDKLKTPKHPDEAFVWRCLSTKAKCWSYENEWRAFINLNDATWSEVAGRMLYFANFGSELKLCDVLIGAVSSIKPKEVFDMVDGDVRVTHVRLSDSRFELALSDCVR
jgi:hypothetical protein